MSCHNFAQSLDIISQDPKDATLQGKGEFPLLHGKVSKDVFVIFRLDEWQDHLFEHLHWPQESHALHVFGHFVGCYLEKKHRKVWFQPKILQGNGNFTAPF